MLLRPRKQSTGVLARVFGAVNRGLERTTRGYVSLSHGLIRKPVIAVAVLLLFALVSTGLGRRLPTSFLPEEDYGYFLLNVQLPPAASLDRTDAVTRKIDALLAETEGVVNYNTIVGFSLLTRVTASNNAFYFVQLANFMARKPEPSESQWAELREAQTKTLSVPNTGMAVAIDIGEADDIHPKNKREVGRRLALIALNKTYGQPVVYEGPIFSGLTIAGSTARVTFRNGALTTTDGGAPRGFQIAGDDKKHARIEALEYIADRLAAEVPMTPPPLDPEVEKVARKALGLD